MARDEKRKQKAFIKKKRKVKERKKYKREKIYTGYGAIDYAKKIGFEPQKDFKLSRFVLDEPSEGDLTVSVEFGKDGKPFYIAGPDDNIDYIMKKLIKNVGEGNFKYILSL